MESVTGPVSIGVDIGQRRDATAIVVAEGSRRKTGKTSTHRKPAGEGAMPGRIWEEWVDEELETVFLVRHIERLPLGTSYPRVAGRIAELAGGVHDRVERELETLRSWVDPNPERPPLHVLVDATGVGRPIVDLLRNGIGTAARLTGVTLTGGRERKGGLRSREVTIGKEEFVSRLKSLTQTGRVHLPDTQEGREIADELLDYEIRSTEKSSFLAGAFRSGAHDDRVTALGLAVLFDPYRRAGEIATQVWV